MSKKNPMKLLISSFSFLLFFQFAFAQKNYKVVCVGFYNLENLFDTVDDPSQWGDDEFLPTTSKNWTNELYHEKLDRLAQVISEVGQEKTPDGPALLGVAEVENRKVLEDLVQHSQLKKQHYQIIHFESPDHRGIDVGLLYQAKYFEPAAAQPLSLKVGGPTGDTLYTRDILYVAGKLDGEMVHVFVNHWPSRSGGESATSPLRQFAASINKRVVDSLYQAEDDPKIIIMGDLNDDPTSSSVKKVLAATKSKNATKAKGLFNPMFELYRKGIGTLAYRDAWNLFDQLIISEPLINEAVEGYQFYQAKIFNKNYLMQKMGQYAGYPFRTFVGNNYMGGYSDHFPVYLFLIREAN